MFLDAVKARVWDPMQTSWDGRDCMREMFLDTAVRRGAAQI